MMTGKTISLSGMAEKSNRPLQYSHADMIGLRVAWRKRPRVSSAWSKSLSHMYLGKEGSTPKIMASKYNLNVRIALSNALRRWTLDGTG